MSNGAGENESAYAALLSEELARITGRLRGLGAERIILFGSYAKGRADLGTDLDLIAVMRSELPFVERTGEIYRELAPRVAADILFYTPEEWVEMQERPFIQMAVKEGRVLYAKDAERGGPPVAGPGA